LQARTLAFNFDVMGSYAEGYAFRWDTPIILLIQNLEWL